MKLSFTVDGTLQVAGKGVKLAFAIAVEIKIFAYDKFDLVGIHFENSGVILIFHRFSPEKKSFNNMLCG